MPEGSVTPVLGRCAVGTCRREATVVLEARGVTIHVCTKHALPFKGRGYEVRNAS